MKVGPEVSLVGIGQHIKDQPYPAKVNKGEKSSNADCKNGHGFGSPGNGISPSSPEKMENGRDQGPGVGNSHPEDEIDQVGPPGHRIVLATRPYSHRNLIGPAGSANENPQGQ